MSDLTGTDKHGPLMPFLRYQGPMARSALLQSESECSGNTVIPTKLHLILTLGVPELISPSNDRKNKAPCCKVLIGDNACCRNLSPVEQHEPEGAEIRSSMGRADIGWITERTCGGTDSAVSSGQLTIFLVAEIVAELESLILKFPPREFRSGQWSSYLLVLCRTYLTCRLRMPTVWQAPN